MTTKVSQFPCPICKEIMFVTGKDKKGNTLTSCGHKYAFRGSKSKKEMDRKYIQTPWGLELAPKE